MSNLIQRDGRVCWHPFTQHGIESEPLAVVGAKGAQLELEDGRKLIDGISSWWAILHGHGEETILKAINEQYERLDHVLFAGATHEPAVRLAERLCALTPQGLNRVFFSDDGSTAVEVALKMVVQRWVLRDQPLRRTFVAFEGAYHGDTFGAMAVGDPDPFFEPFRPLLFDVRRVGLDAQEVGDALDDLGERAAGVIVEPRLMGAAGMKIQPSGFLKNLEEAVHSRDLPLIADEVFTGFGRTGKLFACDSEAVTPDLLCLAKGLTGGMFPLSATLAREEFFEDFLSSDRSRAFFHGHTFTAHPVGCAAALASLDLIADHDTPRLFERLGKRLLRSLTDLNQNPRVRNLRQLGGMVAFELASDQPEGYLAARSQGLRKVAQEHGVLLRPLGDTLYALPPACTNDQELDQIAAALHAMVKSND